MRHFKLDPSDMEQMYRTIRAGGIMGEQGVSDMLLAAIRDGYTDTWFVSPFGDGRQLASTATGSRPGESFADAVYAYVYSRVLRRIAEVAEGEDLMSHKTLEEDMGIYGRPGQGVPVQTTDATWADDSVFPLDADDSHQLVQRAQRLAAVVITECESVGMEPNLKRRKTTFVLALRGKGTQKARQVYFAKHGDALWLPDMAVQVPIAPQYLQLGGVVDKDANMAAEMRHRLALAGAAYDSGKTLLFQNSRVDDKGQAV